MRNLGTDSIPATRTFLQAFGVPGAGPELGLQRGAPVPGAHGRPDGEREPRRRLFSDGRSDRGISRAAHHKPHPGWRALRTDHPDHARLRDPLVDRHQFHGRQSDSQGLPGWFDQARRSSTGFGTTGPTPPSSTSCHPRGVPAPWRITDGSLDAVGGAVGILHTGLSWTDYTMSFDTLVVSGSAGWVVRASSPDRAISSCSTSPPGRRDPQTPCRRSPSARVGLPSSLMSFFPAPSSQVVGFM